MRRVERIGLPNKTAQALDDYQQEADHRSPQTDFDAGAFWNNRRNSAPIHQVFATLKRMAGARERCMYCVDSEGRDIEHFWPKTPYPNKMFLWENLLLCCTNCGRLKGERFLVKNGEPLLIDPTTENPWEHLDFDPQTGNIVPRVDPATGTESPKGNVTVNLLHLDQRQGVANGYRKTVRCLAAIVSEIIESGFSEEHLRRLLEADDHGFLGWCFYDERQNNEPFKSLREKQPEVWARCQQEFR